MKKIGIISDTHAWWDDRYAQHFADCDEVWHAGDIGSDELADKLETIAPVFRAVCGNVDGASLRRRYKEMEIFEVAIIPYTREITNFHCIEVGTVVNLEFDIIGKYLARLMEFAL